MGKDRLTGRRWCVQLILDIWNLRSKLWSRLCWRIPFAGFVVLVVLFELWKLVIVFSKGPSSFFSCNVARGNVKCLYSINFILVNWYHSTEGFSLVSRSCLAWSCFKPRSFETLVELSARQFWQEPEKERRCFLFEWLDDKKMSSEKCWIQVIFVGGRGTLIQTCLKQIWIIGQRIISFTKTE